MENSGVNADSKKQRSASIGGSTLRDVSTASPKRKRLSEDKISTDLYHLVSEEKSLKEILDNIINKSNDILPRLIRGTDLKNFKARNISITLHSLAKIDYDFNQDDYSKAFLRSSLKELESKCNDGTITDTERTQLWQALNYYGEQETLEKIGITEEKIREINAQPEVNQDSAAHLEALKDLEAHKNDRNIEINKEELIPKLGSNVDILITKTNEDKRYYVQIDGSVHFHKKNSENDYNIGTDFQNRLFRRVYPYDTMIRPTVGIRKSGQYGRSNSDAEKTLEEHGEEVIRNELTLAESKNELRSFKDKHKDISSQQFENLEKHITKEKKQKGKEKLSPQAIEESAIKFVMNNEIKLSEESCKEFTKHVINKSNAINNVNIAKGQEKTLRKIVDSKRKDVQDFIDKSASQSPGVYKFNYIKTPEFKPVGQRLHEKYPNLYADLARRMNDYAPDQKAVDDSVIVDDNHMSLKNSCTVEANIRKRPGSERSGSKKRLAISISSDDINKKCAIASDVKEFKEHQSQQITSDTGVQLREKSGGNQVVEEEHKYEIDQKSAPLRQKTCPSSNQGKENTSNKRKSHHPDDVITSKNAKRDQIPKAAHLDRHDCQQLKKITKSFKVLRVKSVPNGADTSKVSPGNTPTYRHSDPGITVK